MAILPITIWGDKVLREKAEPIEKVDDKLIVTIQDMFETMREANGIGLAANQVGINKSLFVIDLTPMEEFKDTKPMVFINPEIVEASDSEVYYEEGCLSLPNLVAEVARPEAIKIKYLDTDENEQFIEDDDWLARVIQHEYDHLLGKMIPDRVEPKIKKAIQQELKDIKNRIFEVNYPFTKK